MRVVCVFISAYLQKYSSKFLSFCFAAVLWGRPNKMLLNLEMFYIYILIIIFIFTPLTTSAPADISCSAVSECKCFFPASLRSSNTDTKLSAVVLSRRWKSLVGLICVNLHSLPQIHYNPTCHFSSCTCQWRPGVNNCKCFPACLTRLTW